MTYIAILILFSHTRVNHSSRTYLVCTMKTLERKFLCTIGSYTLKLECAYKIRE